MLTLNRPALITSDEQRLTQEYASARWIHHRLLDFEDQHQRVLDETAEQIAPGIVRIGRILARLARRARRAERSAPGAWSPNPRAELAKTLRARLAPLRELRNADPRWKAALGWADEQVGEPKQVRRRRAKPADKIKRRKTETEEAFRKRFELLTTDETDEHYLAKVAAAPKETRRDRYRKELYASRRIYWGTWNALVKSVDQARADVLKLRKQGMPAEIRRPKYRDPASLAADAGGFRVVERDCGGRWVRDESDPTGHRMVRQEGAGPWWVIEMRLGTNDEWVRLRAKCGTWHEIPADAKITTAKLTRRKDGERWGYSLSLTVDGVEKKSCEKEPNATAGVVAFDWGHREHGHPNAKEGLRAFTWLGSDGRQGEVLIPRECREALDEIDALKSRLDETFNARKAAHRLPDRNRHGYRRRLMRNGVCAEEETAWLRWEMRYERRIAKRRARVSDLRREVYLNAVRELRSRYATFAFEGESVSKLKMLQKDEQMLRRKRSNRDLATRYEFVAICERFGAEIVTVTSRNSTRECPEPRCGGVLPENGPELVVACPACGTVRDKDHGATRVILRRAEEALANRAA